MSKSPEDVWRSVCQLENLQRLGGSELKLRQVSEGALAEGTVLAYEYNGREKLAEIASFVPGERIVIHGDVDWGIEETAGVTLEPAAGGTKLTSDIAFFGGPWPIRLLLTILSPIGDRALNRMAARQLAALSTAIERP